MEKGELKVETNKRAVSLRKDEVIGLVPGAEKGKENFWREMEGNLDVGYSLTRGNMIWSTAKLPQHSPSHSPVKPSHPRAIWQAVWRAPEGRKPENPTWAG